jgi:hypothetical protein
MSKRRGKVRTFFARLKFAYVNARRSKKQFKENGIVFLPNGSVLVDPRKSLSSFGYTTIPSAELYGSGDYLDDLDDDGFYEDEEDEDALY